MGHRHQQAGLADHAVTRRRRARRRVAEEEVGGVKTPGLTRCESSTFAIGIGLFASESCHGPEVLLQHPLLRRLLRQGSCCGGDAVWTREAAARAGRVTQ